MSTIHNEEHRRVASRKIVATAQRVLSGDLSVIAGARQLSGLRFDVNAERDPDFIFFSGVDSETDHLPVGEVRSRWSADTLKAKDKELQAYEASVRDKAFEVCRRLVQRYETHET
jgi:hypothetical protein